MSFSDILSRCRRDAFSERDKGTRFERFMQAYLRTDPKYSKEFEEIWIWNEFPYRQEFSDGKDIGIDIVAKTSVDEYWAVQCKCYDEGRRIIKSDVDTFLATSGKIFLDQNRKLRQFAHRLWISTTNNWSSEAENIIRNQNPAVSRVGLSDLEQAPVDWDKLDKGIFGPKARTEQKVLRPHQVEALNRAHEYFQNRDRGKLIMACGTGKTLTSLKIAEKETNGQGVILFLVPSIALLGQILNEWSSEAEKNINAICVCSDSTVSKKSVKSDEDFTSVVDLALPASTDISKIVKQFKEKRKRRNRMTVIFSTYQSIDVVAQAQAELIKELKNDAIFDLVVCDEAHRTTGVILAGKNEESAFTKVHDNQIIKARKRLYMTATPRLYEDSAKKKAEENDCILCSMDDEKLYGEEIYRIGFGEAVQKDLLSDYKVLVLTLRDDQMPAALQKAIADPNDEINTDDATKLIGCINALSKRVVKDVDNGVELLNATDSNPMHTAVAFCSNIKASKKIEKVFNMHAESYYESLTAAERNKVMRVHAEHVDGSMRAASRDEKLSWLKQAPTEENKCRILTNVRCLSEGVDVPSLDAVMFLSARNSQVDVVQSVGRVMRKSPGKEYGYIIIPVVVPADVKPEDALNKNENFKVVWTVLNALRAHDDRFDAKINKIELNKGNPNNNGTVVIGTVPDYENKSGEIVGSTDIVKQLTMQFGELQSVVYARMVQKVGTRKYWEQWAKDIAQIAQRHVNRITQIADDEQYRDAFEEFMNGLHANINPYISKKDAIEMLAEHIITRPVFEALFENYSFVKNNSVSIAMQKILNVLDSNALDKENETLEKFYKDVKRRCEGIDNAEGKQKVIIELYEKFFGKALEDVVKKLGIVYTPVEIVDFIINSVSDLMQKEFGRDISGKNVHILDPFTGTGTFITRLLQSGRIKPEDLKRKYESELHANEIVLLAYYIASVNIENAYHDLIGAEQGDYQNFENICLTDTFQQYEDDDKIPYSEFFPKNIKRIKNQKEAPITIIIGNPPYSVGQKSANDNAQNQKYENLERRIADTYAKYSSATLKNSLYDTYIKAFRWASDRLDKTNGGIIGFVSNGGWLDGAAMDGFRKCLEDEFSSIYVFNLRGNQRTSGETSRKEGGKIFGSGSRTPISITILIKKPQKAQEKANIYYHDIGDYLSREEKLNIISKSTSVMSPKFKVQLLSPNEHKDWLNRRNEIFNAFFALGDKKSKNATSTFFKPYYSMGLASSRDAWCYNSSKIELEKNIRNTIEFYNSEVKRCQPILQNNKNIDVSKLLNNDPTKFSWDAAQREKDLPKGRFYEFEKKSIKVSCYRPFCTQFVYMNRDLNNRVYQIPKLFPTESHNNLVICVSGVGASKKFSSLITKYIPCLDMIEKSQCFPLYWYEQKSDKHQQEGLFTSESNNDEYIRHDGITDFIHKLAQKKYGTAVKKEDIFYYVYGLLHSEDYRSKFASDLKKMLPRLPLLKNAKDFWEFSKVGRKLAELHLNYENQSPLNSVNVIGDESGIFNVQKMKFKQKDDKSKIKYNDYIRITNIPAIAYEYVINGRSAIEWIMDRYRIRTDEKSRIRNDPNKWAEEHNKPRYILDLLLSVISLSVETVKIIKSLPKVDFEKESQDYTMETA